MLPSYYEFHNPVKILSGHKALDNLPYELDQLGVRRPFVITDQGVLKAGLIGLVTDAFAESGMTIGALYDQVPVDSSVATVNELARIYRRNNCDSIVAVGGGSVIDTAKGVNILVTENGDDLRQFAGAEVLKRPMRPLVVIPTTAGTGSEVTTAAVIYDPDRDIKMGVTSRHLFPRLAVLDPRMTTTLPPQLTAATAMDALTHAMEASICLQKNPLSDAHAWAAIRLISQHLVRVLEHGQDAEGRLALANAACMAGAAFSNAMVGIVHALGHACGGTCRVPHGVAMSVLLPHGLEYNMDKAGTHIGELLLPLAGAEDYAATPAAERASKCVNSVRVLQRELHRLTGLPYTLRQAGVEKGMLPTIARLALDDGCIVFNPEEVEYDDALRVLGAAYDG